MNSFDTARTTFADLVPELTRMAKAQFRDLGPQCAPVAGRGHEVHQQRRAPGVGGELPPRPQRLGRCQCLRQAGHVALRSPAEHRELLCARPDLYGQLPGMKIVTHR